MNPKQREEFLEFVDADIVAINAVVHKLAEKLHTREDVSELSDGLNLVFAAVSDGFGIAVAVHGWLELREKECKLSVHSCGSVLKRFSDRNLLEKLRPALYKMVEQVQKEPRKILLLSEDKDGRA